MNRLSTVDYGDGETQSYGFDPMGNRTSNNVTSSPKYDVYGLVRANPGTASSAMGFVGGLGHLSEAGTGLIYMKARYYDPSIGRFASQDPSKDGTNWFVYCDDNPVNLIDKDGKSPTVDAIVIILAGLALAVAAVGVYAALVPVMAAIGAFGAGAIIGLLVFAGIIGLAACFYGFYMLGQASKNPTAEGSAASASIGSSIIAGFPAGEALAIASLGLDSSDD